MAQIVGAVASVVLGVLVLQRMNNPTAAPTTPAVPASALPAASVPAASRPAGEIALAVLPLDNFSGDAAQEYFADGITEALTADLAQIDGLHVISRTSTMSYKGQQKPLRQIAQELGVDLVVEGSVVRANNRVRVTAQLIDAKTDRHLWARSYDRTIRDVLSLQAEVATAIATEVKGAIGSTQVNSIPERRAIDPVAYDLYLRGRHAWNLRTREGYDNAARYFTDATKRDPEFALAYAGLADVYSLQGAPYVTGLPGDNLKQARAAAERAIQLDPRLAEAHTSLGAVYFFGERDFAAAEREYRRAIELNPHYATARQWLAIALSEQGRHAEALEHATEAVKQDPLSGTMQQTLALVHYYARRYDDAEAAGRRAMELNPRLVLARNITAKALLLQGDNGAAVALLEPGSARSPETLMLLGVAQAKAGNRAAADALWKELSSRQPPPTSMMAQWQAATGNVAEAVRLFAATPGTVSAILRVDPLFDALGRDPQFAALAKRDSDMR